jgi:hypothetical protein
MYLPNCVVLYVKSMTKSVLLNLFYVYKQLSAFLTWSFVNIVNIVPHVPVWYERINETESAKDATRKDRNYYVGENKDLISFK